MPEELPPSPRPLLRLTTDQSVEMREVAANEFGGVILEPSTHSNALAEAAHAHGLEVWLDVSSLSHPDLPRWKLDFDQYHPRPVRSASTLLDLFDEGSAQHIIFALEPYAGSISGILLDPHWRDASTSLLPEFPWTSALHDLFDQEKLASLVTNTGERAAAHRIQFWGALSHLYAQNLQRLRAWCASQNLRCQALPLLPEWEALQLSEVLSARLSTDWPHLLRGDSFTPTLQNAYGFLHAGVGRFQVEYSGAFAFGTSRLNRALAYHSAIVANTTNTARIGVLLPTRSCRTHYHPDGHRFTRWVADDLKRITTPLDELHFNWVFVHEDNLFPAEYSLELVVVPSITALARSSWTQLEKFVESGGKIACLGLLPRWNETGRDHEWEEQVGKAALLTIEDLYTAYGAQETGNDLPPTLGYPVFREHLSGGRLCCYQPRLNEDEDDARLRTHQILHESIAPDFENQLRKVRYAQRSSEDKNYFFVWNSDTVTQHVHARLRPETELFTAREIKSLDALRAQEKVLYSWMSHPVEQGGGLSVSLALASGEARWIQIAPVPAGEALHTSHIERATFVLEYFDGRVARGYATQSGIQRIAVRHHKKLHSHESELLKVPAPLLLDEWQSTPAAANVQFEMTVEVPADWQRHRIFLEVAGLEGALELSVNEQTLEPLLAPPLQFDVTSALQAGTLNRFILRSYNSQDHDQFDDEVIARLAAYPVVEINIALPHNEEIA